MRMVTLVCCVCLLGSCRPKPPTPATNEAASKPVAPAIVGLPVTMTVKQRSQTVVPGSSQGLTLSAGDITRGKVEAALRSESGVFLQPAFMEEGDRRPFEYQQGKYELALVKLDNALVGEDFATFTLSEAASEEKLTEAQKIDRLIARVESLEGATFLRNGSEHSPADAAQHLREKRARAGDAVKTVDDFIEQVGSKSSLSGDEYEIRFRDGRVVKAGEFLRREAAESTGKADAVQRAP
ncbi:hypothetical protein Pan44_05330 [Caulifigura coniformis]|uniref:Lipoprotein n=2 Tax=Caulifigura coniformis TaxID=2527983 RepID=A0A517S8R3_9PLAN|nr:hypothetical protein Pan44_05330 [Caulifigura coniformis]